MDAGWGMLMLGSCREDYWALNPPKFLNALTLRQGAVGGCSSARRVVGGWEGNSPCTTTGGISAWSHLLILHHPPASTFLSDLEQSCPPHAPV